MPPEKRSHSRGRVTITLTNPKEYQEEKAKVSVTLSEPEKMVERVVHELARKFPPESVMTIDARNDTSSICSSSLENAAGVKKKQFRLLHEDSFPEQDVWTVQSYIVSDELDVAIPIAPTDTEVQLVSGGAMPVREEDVVTCIYSPSGFLNSVQQGFFSEHAFHNHNSNMTLPTKPGIGLFVQHVVINDIFNTAAPICAGQSFIHLADGDLYSIQSQNDIYAVFFSEKGFARFTSSSPFAHQGQFFIGQVVNPGIPGGAASIPTTALPLRVISDEAIPIALSSASKAYQCGEKRINVALYDESGAFICQRKHTGGILPLNAISNERFHPVHQVRYIWIPAARLTRKRKPAEVLRIAPLAGPSQLADGNVANPCLPKDIDIILYDKNDNQIGAFVADRKPSLVMGNLEKIQEYIPPYVSRPQVNNTSHTGTSETAATTDDEVSADESASVHTARSAHRRLPARIFHQEVSEEEHVSHRSRRKERSATHDADVVVARRQAYFCPKEIDYAIPVVAGQTSVKLVNGDKLKIDMNRTFVVSYDIRGFPISTMFPDGRKQQWVVNEAGVGIHVQDYYVDPSLVYAVPITPTQTEIQVDDGSTIEIDDHCIVSVFYDASGRPAFSYNTKKRIRPGLVSHPGIASTAQYVWLMDCLDGSDEQFVIPVKGFQKKVQDPHNPGKTLDVRREKLTVIFFDENKNPLYTKLRDGSLVTNGLTAVEDDSSSSRYQRVFSEDCGATRLSSGCIGTSLYSSNNASCKVIERQVPVQKIEYRDRIVEVPEVRVVEKRVEVEKVEYVTKYVKKKETVEREVEHVKYVPRIETKIVERVIEIPQIVEVERKEIIEQKVQKDNFIDHEQEVVVQNTLIPVLRDDVEVGEVEVECLRLEPELVPVDVYVPKLIRGKLLSLGTSHTVTKPIDVPIGHYNSLVITINPSLGENYERLPLIKINDTTYPMLNRNAKVTVHQPTDEEILQFLQKAQLVL